VGGGRRHRPDHLPAGDTAATGRWTPGLLEAAARSGAAVCPVGVAVRTAAGQPMAQHELRDVGTVRRAMAAGGLVVRIRLLPALDCPPTDVPTALARAGVLPPIPPPREPGDDESTDERD